MWQFHAWRAYELILERQREADAVRLARLARMPADRPPQPAARPIRWATIRRPAARLAVWAATLLDPGVAA